VNEEAKKQDGGEVDPSILPVLLSASGLVSTPPCRLYSIVAVGAAAANNLYYLRDGNLVTSEIKIPIEVGQYSTVVVIFKHPVRFPKGLYAEFNTGGFRLFMQYRPDY